MQQQINLDPKQMAFVQCETKPLPSRFFFGYYLLMIHVGFWPEKLTHQGWPASKYSHHSTKSFTLGMADIEKEHFSVPRALCAAFISIQLLFQGFPCPFNNTLAVQQGSRRVNKLSLQPFLFMEVRLNPHNCKTAVPGASEMSWTCMFHLFKE